MTDTETSDAAFAIRESGPDDGPSITALYPRAFPKEDLRPLVASLLESPDDVLSLVARTGSTILGHVACTRCKLEGKNLRLAILGPLAVDPNHQGRGIGSALINEGIDRMRSDGARVMCVLGDPAYYGKFEFTPEPRIEPPYPLPEEWRAAWLSRRLADRDEQLIGRMKVPAPWRDPALWAP